MFKVVLTQEFESLAILEGVHKIPTGKVVERLWQSLQLKMDVWRSPAQKVAKWSKGAKWSNRKSMANYASAKMIKLKHFIYNNYVCSKRSKNLQGMCEAL